MFHKLLKKLVCQGPCFPKACWPDGPVAKRPSQDGLSLSSLLASSDSLLLHICSCFHISWYWNWSQTAPSLSPTKYPTTLNLPQRGRCDKFWGPWTEVTHVPRSFLPSGQHYPFTPCPPSLTPHPPICLWPPCPGRLSRVTPSPSLVWLLLSEREDLPGRPALSRLTEFPVSFHYECIYLVHSFLESTWAGAPAGHFLDEDFSSLRSELLLAFSTIRN